MDRESIKRKLQEQFEQSLDKALDAVEHAGDLKNLISLRESGQWKACWNRRAAA